MMRLGSGLTAPGDPPLRERALFSLLIADADDAFRRLVRQHLGRVIAVVGEVGDGDEAVRMAKRLQPDVVLMDFAIPLIGGPEAARRIKADRAETKVVLLTSGHKKTDPGGPENAGGPAPLLHADAVLPKKRMRAGILSHVGRLGRRRSMRVARDGRAEQLLERISGEEIVMKQSLALAAHPVVSLPVPLGGPPAAEGALIDLPAILDGTIVPIATAADIFTAREEGRVLAARLGFSAWDQTMIASAISELARNMLEFATGGSIALTSETLGNRVGLVIEARDNGPGIADPAIAVAGGGSSSKGPGFGLPGVNRLMDEFDIASELGKGTTITAKKWRRAGAAGRMADVGRALSGQETGKTRCLIAP